MSKETSVEFLIQQIELALKLNKVQINFEYRIKTINPVYEIARKMEREQIKESYKAGFNYRDSFSWECDAPWESKEDLEGNEEEFDRYYNETYKGGEQ